MPVSEKEIIERLPDWIAEKKTSFLFGSGTSAPGMPLMNMFPGKKDGSTDVDGLMYEIIKRNKFLIGAKMKINVSEEESKAILGTLGAYKKFIEVIKVQSTKFLSMERKVFWAQKTQILSLSQIFEISFNYFDIIVCISHNDNK